MSSKQPLRVSRRAFTQNLTNVQNACETSYPTPERLANLLASVVLLQARGRGRHAVALLGDRPPGIDPTKIQNWEDFVNAVKKCQAAGVTPIAVGGKDKWPLHFYPTFLMMRILGNEGMQAVYEDKNGGFTSPEVLKAFQLYKEFAALQPFQKGYLSNTYAESAGTFHDGKAAFHLMGTWDLIEGRADSTDKKGLPNDARESG